MSKIKMLKTKEKRMKKYGVEFNISGKAIVYVEASDNVEAIEKAESEVALSNLYSFKPEEAERVWELPIIHRVTESKDGK